MQQHDTPSQCLTEIIEAILMGTCTEAQSRQLAQLGPEAVQLAVLAAAAKIAELAEQIPHPSTPSGQIPVYTKPNKKKRKTKRGAKPGHPPARRKTPERINRHQEHRCDACPDCGGPLQRCNRSRKRIIEDLPEDIEAEITEHTIHRDYCPHCRKHVEPVVPDALPKASLGHRLVCFTSTPTKPAGGSAAGPIGYGVSPTVGSVIT